MVFAVTAFTLSDILREQESEDRTFTHEQLDEFKEMYEPILHCLLRCI